MDCLKQWKLHHKKNAGTTLVELIVTFGLIGLLFTAVATVIFSSARMFERIQSTSNAVSVSDLLLDKISGEITAAKVAQDAQGHGSTYYFWLETNEASPWVAFENRSGSPMTIYANEATDDNLSVTDDLNGQIVIKYYSVVKSADGSGASSQSTSEIDWHFDERVYMGYAVTKLNFSRPSSTSNPNVIKIDLTIKNRRTGFTYSTSRYADNYNYDPDSEGRYMVNRNDGSNGQPSEAADFTIQTSETSTEAPTEPPTAPTTPTTPQDKFMVSSNIPNVPESLIHFFESGEFVDIPNKSVSVYVCCFSANNGQEYCIVLKKTYENNNGVKETVSQKYGINQNNILICENGTKNERILAHLKNALGISGTIKGFEFDFDNKQITDIQFSNQ